MKIGEQITRLQLNKSGHPLRYIEEKVKGRAAYVAHLKGERRALQIVTDTEPVNQLEKVNDLSSMFSEGEETKEEAT